jgi:hypothetical protein
MPIMTKNSPPDDSQFVRSQIGAIPAFLSTGKGTKYWKRVTESLSMRIVRGGVSARDGRLLIPFNKYRRNVRSFVRSNQDTGYRVP